MIDATNLVIYSRRVPTKKVGIRIGVLCMFAAKSRNRKGIAAFSFCAPVYGGTDGGLQSPLVNRSANVPVRQSVRTAALIGVGVSVISKRRSGSHE